MKVKLSTGAEYYVDFYVRKKQAGNHTTICMIVDTKWKPVVFNSENKRNKKRHARLPKIPPSLVHGIGISKCNKKDEYNKVVGKVKSLDRALDQTFPSTNISSTETNNHRMLRLEIWAQVMQQLAKSKDFCVLQGLERWF